MCSYSPIKNIAIIGAGPTGLAAAKFLLAEKAFDRIDIFEQQSHVGGVWIQTTPRRNIPLDVPQTNPNQPLEEPIWLLNERNGAIGKSRLVFPTPLYDQLETNIPNVLMQYSDKPFPSHEQLFPRHETVTEYLEEYAQEVRHFISFQTQVLDVRLRDGDRVQWNVTIKDLPTSAVNTEVYDAVVAANGHYSVPFIPHITGIKDWDEAYPGLIQHSKFYRSPEIYRDKKAIVVGNSASGLDIGTQIGGVCKKPLLCSRRSEPYLSPGPASWKEELPEIVEFLSPKSYDRAVKFADGRTEEGIEGVVFATGYFYSFPFLRSLQPPLIDDGTRTLGVYKHFIYIQQPTLAIPVLNQKIIPFPLAENQAAVIARVWSGRLSLPSKEEMYAWEKSVLAERGPGKAFHTLGFPTDVEYINEMHDWSMQAMSRVGLENDGKGRQGPRWTEKDQWTRERFPAIRKAFAERGEARHSVRTLEELGYDFEAWKAEEESQDTSKSLL